VQKRAERYISAMQRGATPPRPILFLAATALLIGIVAIPALAASPSPPPSGGSAAASPVPDGAKPSKAPRADKRAKTPEVEVTLTGTLGTRTAADGEVEYTLTSGATTVVLDAGPAWFYKDNHPLKPFVGKTVTVVGDQRQGSTGVDVRSVDGTEIRAAGRPPWAGGWKRVGKDHPGWSQEKWDKWQAKLAERIQRLGTDCWPPGHCKTPAEKRAVPSPSAEPSPTT
jgi:hypothetical protein